MKGMGGVWQRPNCLMYGTYCMERYGTICRPMWYLRRLLRFSDSASTHSCSHALILTLSFYPQTICFLHVRGPNKTFHLKTETRTFHAVANHWHVAAMYQCVYTRERDTITHNYNTTWKGRTVLPEKKQITILLLRSRFALYSWLIRLYLNLCNSFVCCMLPGPSIKSV